MSEAAVAGLGLAATRIATRAALAYLREHKIEMDDTMPLCALLAAEVKAALPAALDDAREAIACNMREIAEQTFAASLALAGIKAAKMFAACPLCNMTKDRCLCGC